MLSSSSPPRLPPDALKAVEAYEVRIEELLTSCADHQRHDPEVFLWNARRALEAVCHLLLTVHKAAPSRVEKSTVERTLEGMIKQLAQEGVLDREQEPRFQMARAHTNLGVHIQQPERADYAAAVSDTSTVLPRLVEWLYTKSIAQPHLKLRSKMPLDVILAGGRDGPSLKAAATTASRELHLRELEIGRLGRELDEKDRALRAREARAWRWMSRVFVSSAACLALGVCAGASGTLAYAPGASVAIVRGSVGAVGAERVASSGSAPFVRSAAPPVSPVERPPVAGGSDASAATTEVTDVGTPEAVSCPRGMVYVPARRGMTLGQPIGGRNNWPRPRRESLDPFDVSAFCIDVAPRARADVGSAYDAAAVARCERDDERPTRTCLDRDEAERACAEVVEGRGHLPSVVEWESAARADIPVLEMPVQEWVGERFPPAVFQRFDPTWSSGDGMWVGPIPPARTPTTSDGVVVLGWNQQDPANRNTERGFRCAVSVVEP